MSPRDAPEWFVRNGHWNRRQPLWKETFVSFFAAFLGALAGLIISLLVLTVLLPLLR